MFSPSIQKLIKLFSKFPTVGPRTASRFVFFLINSPKQEVKELIEAIAELKNKIKHCQKCQKAFETYNGEDICEICQNSKRDNGQICIVEKEVDLETLEKTGSFKGTYFVLGDNLSVLKSNDQILEKKLQILIERIKSENDNTKEIIIALNPTQEGQNTSLWIKRRIEPLKEIKITQLGIGLPSNSELEYADETTIESALQNRR